MIFSEKLNRENRKNGKINDFWQFKFPRFVVGVVFKTKDTTMTLIIQRYKTAI